MNRFVRMMRSRGYWEEAGGADATGTGGSADSGWNPPEAFGAKDKEIVEAGLKAMDEAFGPEDTDTSNDPEAKDENPDATKNQEPEEKPREEVKPEEEDPRSDEEKAADELRAHKGDGDIQRIPKAWKSGLAEQYKALPDDIKAEIHRREENFWTGFERMKPAVDFAVEMDEAFRPFATVLQEQQATPAKAVNYLLSVYTVLTKGTPENRLQGIRHLMKEAGVSPEQLGAQPTDEDAYIDPAVKALREELSAVKSDLDGRKAQEVQAARDRAAREYDAFVKANPLAEKVMDDMLPYIRGGMSLADAFEKAKWANPVVRAQLQKEQADLAKAEAEKKQQEKAARARQASRTAVKDNSRSGGPTAPIGSIEDTMADVMSSIKSRS